MLVASCKITQVQEINPILELAKKMKRSLVVFSEDLQKDPLSMMVYNNSKGIIQCCAVNIPWMGDVQKEYLKDIAVQCGATFIDDEYGVKLSEVKLEHFGSAQKIAMDGYTSTIVGGSGE